MLSVWKSVLPNLFLNLGAAWIQFGAIWINLKTLSVKWRSHTLPRPDCVNILWTIHCGLHLAEYVTKSISKFRHNVNKILFSHYRLENGGHISRPQCANTLLLKQNSFYFADDILTYIFEFVLLLHMQLSYLQNEFEIMVCKISAILSLPGCVNTLWQRQSDLYFEDNIFNFIPNFRWNLNKI